MNAEGKEYEMEQDQEQPKNESAEGNDSELSDTDLENVAGGGQGGVKGPTNKDPIVVGPPTPAP
jgi:hypothetical protein